MNEEKRSRVANFVVCCFLVIPFILLIFIWAVLWFLGKSGQLCSNMKDELTRVIRPIYEVIGWNE